MYVVEQCQDTIDAMIADLKRLKDLYNSEGFLHKREELITSIIDLHSEITDHQEKLDLLLRARVQALELLVEQSRVALKENREKLEEFILHDNDGRVIKFTSSAIEIVNK